MIELLGVCRDFGHKPVVAWGLTLGLTLGFATDFVLVAAEPRPESLFTVRSTYPAFPPRQPAGSRGPSPVGARACGAPERDSEKDERRDGHEPPGRKVMMCEQRC